GPAGATAPLHAVIGPAAGPCCYEVGAEVFAALAGPGGGPAPATAGRERIDLKAIASARLATAGVAEVHDVGLCTICDERFFSHRREGAAAGRQGAIVWRGRR
ncbi:MAG: polyphenol oxidase family protein, partial [Acidobacteriota bacterium]|nr:polyphenol oxidase family protein [Acidobacteriota bacterium]